MVNFTSTPLGTSATARELNLSESRVRQVATTGELPAVRTTAGQFLFDAADIQRFAAARAERKARLAAARAERKARLA